MNRERALKVVLTVTGVLFVATGYPLVIFLRSAPALSMMFTLYVTLGVYLLGAVRRPEEHRSLISFTAWSSFVHAAVMGVQVSQHMIAPYELLGSVLLVVIGGALVSLGPRRGS